MSRNDAEKILSAKQRKAADVLIRGGSKEKAAKAAGVTVRTIDRYMQDDTFSHYLRDGASKAIHTAAMRITSLLELALNVFYEAMTNPNDRSSVKLRAANYTVTHAIKLMELNDVLDRLEAIEEALGISA